MAFPARKYSEEEREAIFKAHLEGHAAASIVKLARSGELGVAAFELAPRTCRDIIARKLIAETKGKGAVSREMEFTSLGTPLQRIVAKSVEVAEREVLMMKEKQNQGKLVARDFGDFVKALGDLIKIQQSAAKEAAEARRAREEGEPHERTVKRLPSQQSLPPEVARLTKLVREHERGGDPPSEPPPAA